MDIRLLETGAWKEKYGQTESDVETEARTKQFEASLEARAGVRSQTKAGVGSARMWEPWADTWEIGA